MDIFESLENLPVSESCFDDIIGLVEEYINEISDYTAQAPWMKKKAISDKLREKANYGSEEERNKYEDALLDELKHKAKYDSWLKGKADRMKKYEERKAKEDKENDKR